MHMLASIAIYIFSVKKKNYKTTAYSVYSICVLYSFLLIYLSIYLFIFDYVYKCRNNAVVYNVLFFTLRKHAYVIYCNISQL